LQATALATVAAPVIVPAAALGKNGRAAPSERITLGIIGAGERAGQLAQPLLSMAEPPNRGRLRSIAAEAGNPHVLGRRHLRHADLCVLLFRRGKIESQPCFLT